MAGYGSQVELRMGKLNGLLEPAEKYQRSSGVNDAKQFSIMVLKYSI